MQKSDPYPKTIAELPEDPLIRHFDIKAIKAKEIMVFMEETKIWQSLLADCMERSGVNAPSECNRLHEIVQERVNYYNSRFNPALRPEQSAGDGKVMSSFIHYKFKSAKDYDTYRFEGAGVPVWELKQEIIQAKKLGKGLDFDLIISNAQTNEEYLNDMYILPKNSSVLVRRVPGQRNKISVSSKAAANNEREESFQSSQQTVTNSFAGYFPARPTLGQSKVQSSTAGEEGALEDEEAQIQAMMNANSAAWMQNQQMIGSERPRAFKPTVRPPMTTTNLPAMPPPAYYVCFRCGQKGHYIAHCPTNSDPNFDKPRVKKSTGIPRSFLKPVAAPDQVQDGGGSFLVTTDGNLVVAMSNDQEWQKISSSTASSNLTDEIPAELKCAQCSGLVSEPVRCPKCLVIFCEDCLMKAESNIPKVDRVHITCPSCSHPFTSEQLVPSEEIKKALETFLSDKHKTKPSQPTPPLMSLPGVFPPPFPFLPPFPFMPPVPPATQPRPVEEAEKHEKSKPSKNRSRSPEHRRSQRSKSRSRSRSRSPRRSYRR